MSAFSSSFASIVASMDATVQAALGDITITVHPQALGYSDLIIPSCITKNPTLEDDYIPGHNPGVTNLILFFNPASLTLTPQQILPVRGDTATCNGVDYDLSRVDPDREGGYCLYLRQRSVPYTGA